MPSGKVTVAGKSNGPSSPGSWSHRPSGHRRAMVAAATTRSASAASAHSAEADGEDQALAANVPALLSFPQGSLGDEVGREEKNKDAVMKQPSPDDLARAFRERCQVHAWIDAESHDEPPHLPGLAVVLGQLKERVNDWISLRHLTDYKLASEYDLRDAEFRSEILRRIKSLSGMASPLSSNRAITAAPQTGTKTRLLAGKIDIVVSDFPPISCHRGTFPPGVLASYPFRLCGEEWAIEITGNKHWVKIHLAYRGRAQGLYRITSLWFRQVGWSLFSPTHTHTHIHIHTHTHTHARAQAGSNARRMEK